MSKQEKGKRKIWTKEEIQGFLNCYIARKDEFYHSRKKRLAFENVLDDMIKQGLTTSATTIVALETKMRTFYVAYKAAQNNGHIAPGIAPFMDKLNEIFGDSRLCNVDSISDKSSQIDTSDDDRSNISLLIDQLTGSGEVPMKPKIDKVETSEQSIAMSTKRKYWTKEETLGLLLCYQARKDEFSHSRKKKFAYENVLKDMIEQGYTDSSTTLGALDTKMRSLEHAYKAAKENPTKPDSTANSIQCFMAEMDAIFGDQPFITNQSGDYDEEPDQSDTLNEDHFHNLSQCDSMIEEKFDIQSFLKTEQSCGSDSMSTIESGKRKSAQESYYEHKLKLKREELNDAKLARQAKHEQREKFMRDYLSALQDKWNKDHEAEMKKLELLEMLINKK